MKRVALILCAVILCISCEKIDYQKLEGSTWVAETDDVLYTLRFVDASVCTIGTGRKDDTYSSNLTTYHWRYASNVDSRWGTFHLYNMSEEWEYAFSGSVEDKKLYLAIYNNGDNGVWFKRKSGK